MFSLVCFTGILTSSCARSSFKFCNFFFEDWLSVQLQIFKQTLGRVGYWAEMGEGRKKQQLGAGCVAGTANAARPRRTTRMKNSS